MEAQARRTLIGVSVGHAAHDTWYGVAPVLLAALSPQLDISASDIGLMLLFYQAISSLTQPLFGRLSERYGGRPFAVTSIVWTTVMFSAAALAPSKIILAVCIALAGFGSGAWHPQGATNATIAGGKRWGATAAAIFFVGGTLGSAFLGSALSGVLLEMFGRQSLLIISVITITLALTVVRNTVPQALSRVDSSGKPASRAHLGATATGFYAVLAFLLIGIALRSLTNMNIQNYIPKQQQEMGVSPAIYGLVMSLFLFASSVGGLVGSFAADKLGLRRVLVISMVLAGVSLFGFSNTQGLWSYVCLGLTGLFIGPSHTLFVVAGQRRYPERMATMTGLFLGFTFVSGSVGAWLLGLLADRVGLSFTLGLLPWALAGAALCALFGVPEPKSQLVEDESVAPA